MKKFYESPKTDVILIQLGGQLLDVISPGNPGDDADVREHVGWNDDWDDKDWKED